MAIKSQPAQKFVPISEIRDGIVVLNDGSMRMVMVASSINFALKSEDEQVALLAQFQAFLNSLEYSTQILIQSRRLDINPYLDRLRQRLSQPLPDLMRIQIQEYISFIEQFTKQSEIMTKSFFIIIPYTTSAIFTTSKGGGVSSMFSKVMGKKDTTPGKKQPAKQKQESSIDLEKFEEAKSQLQQRGNVVKQGLARVGIRIAPLGTEEITELYYKIFNPPETDTPLST